MNQAAPIDADKAFSGTVAPTGADILDAARLTEWMAANVEGFAGPITIAKFAGGQSNPTYRIDAASGSYVLRRNRSANCCPPPTPSTASIK